MYGLSKESKIFTKFTKYGLYSTHIALYSLVLAPLIQFKKKSFLKL